MKAIEIENLSKSFDGRWVLRNVSFSVDAGEVFGYLGPNGAGKTTTMRVLLGLLRPTSGTALVKGADLHANDEVRHSVGVLMENDGLYDRLSAWQNLDYYGRLYGVKDREERTAELLETFGLSARRGDKVYTFSKGMRRKLGIARSIIHDPEILFLDEPTSGLDPEAQRMVRGSITDLSRREGMTVMLSSHNLDEVEKICTRVAVIKNGEIRAYDTVENLREGRGGHTLAVTLSKEADATAAIEVLRSSSSIIAVRQDGPRLTIAHGEESSSAILASIFRAGIGIEEASKTSRSLEDVYIDLVKEQEVVG
ncbi:MAG: ABC transporter ATP-binding protein [Methanomassiliicoccus sp.]|nr:ABC transporter ATP-binding protein [Methanomassiliicoccus sp.]